MSKTTKKPKLLVQQDVKIAKLGEPKFKSPLINPWIPLINDNQKILAHSEAEITQRYLKHKEPLPAFELAGAREKLFFNPKQVTAGIVTCGGLCPGLNDVIRSLVLTLNFSYGVKKIWGFRFGYNGLSSKPMEKPWVLTPKLVSNIHHHGGTVLGSSRGPEDPKDMVKTLLKLKVNMLFVIGGDGTLRGASALAAEATRQKRNIAVIGVPKTIDNDIMWIARSFGFTTAVEEARRAIYSAHSEAKGMRNGIGIVKVMGRHSGFIAAHSTLANSDVNYCLVPEVPFKLEGKRGFLEDLRKRLQKKHHAVIVIAEGAGQGLIESDAASKSDKSGNVKLKDIGLFLNEKIKSYFKSLNMEIGIKYIDPSYMIRSCPANAIDSEICLSLGQNAVHAAMSGRTNMAVGIWSGRFTHIPIPLMVSSRNEINPHGTHWARVLEVTGQPPSLTE